MGADGDRHGAVTRQGHLALITAEQFLAVIFSLMWQAGTVQSMSGDAYGCVDRLVAEIGDNQRHLTVAVTQVGILLAGVEGILVDIHQVKEVPL